MSEHLIWILLLYVLPAFIVWLITVHDVRTGNQEARWRDILFVLCPVFNLWASVMLLCFAIGGYLIEFFMTRRKSRIPDIFFLNRRGK